MTPVATAPSGFMPGAALIAIAASPFARSPAADAGSVFAGAAHLSVIDYFGDIPWGDFPGVRTWYMKLKSRPCFRPLLADRWPGLAPAPHYDNLDF